MQITIKEEDVLNLINRSVLARKSFDFTPNGIPPSESKPPITMHEGLDEIVEALLNGRVHKNNPEWVEVLDRWWAREHASTIFAIGLLNGRYEDYLPGRYLMYRRLVDDGIKKVMPNTIGKNVIEIGSGSGISLTMLAKEGVIAHGLDISETALGFFEYLAKHYGVRDRVRTIRRDFYQTGLPDEDFELTYNVGVFEHICPKDRPRLLEEMKRITAHHGYIMIAVPNPDSPYYKMMRKREETIFQRAKHLMFPMRDYHKVDPQELLTEGGLEIVRQGYVLLAPSTQIGPKIIKEDDYEFFMGLPQVNGRTSDKIKAWELLEKSAQLELMMKYGWFTYVIGRKP